jgi:hypothetical protein
MTTKKTVGAAEHARRPAGPSQQELLAAYQTHTLAQMLYGQIVITHPWIGQAYPYPQGEPWGAGVAPWAACGPPTWGAGPVLVPGPRCEPLNFAGFPHR